MSGLISLPICALGFLPYLLVFSSLAAQPCLTRASVRSNGTAPVPAFGRETASKKPFLVDGYKFGGGTNIFSVSWYCCRARRKSRNRTALRSKDGRGLHALWTVRIKN